MGTDGAWYVAPASVGPGEAVLVPRWSMTGIVAIHPVWVMAVITAAIQQVSIVTSLETFPFFGQLGTQMASMALPWGGSQPPVNDPGSLSAAAGHQNDANRQYPLARDTGGFRQLSQPPMGQ